MALSNQEYYGMFGIDYDRLAVAKMISTSVLDNILADIVDDEYLQEHLTGDCYERIEDIIEKYKGENNGVNCCNSTVGFPLGNHIATTYRN
jgi:hypothetical protein